MKIDIFIKDAEYKDAQKVFLALAEIQPLTLSKAIDAAYPNLPKAEPLATANNGGAQLLNNYPAPSPESVLKSTAHFEASLVPPVPTVLNDDEYPTVTVTPSDVPPNVELDASGLPWDERIHASTKTKNKDGSWKKRKGGEPALIAAVESELRANNAAWVKVEIKQPIPAVQALGLVPTYIPSPDAMLNQQVLPPATPPVPQAPVAVAATFAIVLDRISKGVASGKVPADFAISVSAAIGVNSIGDIMNNQALLTAADAYITSLGLGF